jgi:para-nitrobenzyl esterase
MQPAPSDCIVSTAAGRARGLSGQGLLRFLGIPYAAAPVGKLRFQAPQAAARWDGIRDATAPGANSPQVIRAFPGLDVTPLVGHGWRPGDEYLTANIWSPDLAARLPVLVFLHGGAFIGGSGDAAVHAGSEFARSGIVYVSINYRLGVEGFLPIPGAVTNLGMRDQIAALRWVAENIERFGGDPGNVTVAGESAGAMTLCNLITSPLAKGLIRRAIAQSGHGSMVRPLNVASRLAERVAATLQVSCDLQGFSQCSALQCANAVDAVSRPEVALDLRDAQGRNAAYGLTRFLPVFGDEVLPEHPLEALRKGAGADVQLLIGTNREEMNIYLVPTGVRQSIAAASACAVLQASEPDAARILDAYGLGQGNRSAGDALSEAMSDLVFRLPARQFASAHRGPAHLYEFGWRSPACDGQLGACHALELPFVFKTLPCCTGAAGIAGNAPPQELADHIHETWVQFIARGRLDWPAFDATQRACMSLETAKVMRDADVLAARWVTS